MESVTGYVCSHCKSAKNVRRVYVKKHNCKIHESICFRNPETHSCATCGLWDFHEDNDGLWKRCSEGHDREDVGMCNGATYPARPQTNCEFWILKIV